MTRESYLKKLIKENGLTIKDFAKKIHMPYSTLLTMLNEEKIGNASVDNVIKICRELNITIQNLQNVLEADSANTQIVLLEHEKKLICHYLEREELQKAVDILLLSDAKAIYR